MHLAAIEEYKNALLSRLESHSQRAQQVALESLQQLAHSLNVKQICFRTNLDIISLEDSERKTQLREQIETLYLAYVEKFRNPGSYTLKDQKAFIENEKILLSSLQYMDTQKVYQMSVRQVSNNSNMEDVSSVVDPTNHSCKKRAFSSLESSSSARKVERGDNVEEGSFVVDLAKQPCKKKAKSSTEHSQNISTSIAVDRSIDESRDVYLKKVQEYKNDLLSRLESHSRLTQIGALDALQELNRFFNLQRISFRDAVDVILPENSEKRTELVAEVEAHYIQYEMQIKNPNAYTLEDQKAFIQREQGALNGLKNRDIQNQERINQRVICFY